MRPHLMLCSCIFFLSGTIAAQEAEREPAPPAGAARTTTEIEFLAHDEVEMFGKLVLPAEGAPRAVVIVMQTAEGATVDMKRPLGNGETFEYYDVYREHLTKMGVGFFSYEGRGVTMGDQPPRYESIDWEVYNTSTLDNKVRDALSAIATVRAREGLAEVPILLLGASEGTLIAAEAATRDPKGVQGLVLYGVLVSNLRETFRYIMSEGAFLGYRAQMDSDDDGKISREEWDAVLQGAADFSEGDLNGDGVFDPADVKVGTKVYLDAIDQDDYEVLQTWAKNYAAVAVPENWFEDHFAHQDNREFLLGLDIPIGLFHGGQDPMTPVGAVRELAAAAKELGREGFEYHEFPELEHTLHIGLWFVRGELPAGHRAIFDFVDRIAPDSAESGG